MDSVILAATPVTFDIITASLEGSIAVVFAKSRGSGYDAAANLSGQADMNETRQIGNTLFHFAVFGRSQRQASLALTVVRNLSGVKSLQIIARGKLVKDHFRVGEVLSCYLDAAALEDPRAHCVEMVHESHLIERFLSSPNASSLTVPLDLGFLGYARGKERLVAFPCRYLRGRFHFQPGHPSSPKAQLLAGAVRVGCEWCPNFLKWSDR